MRRTEVYILMALAAAAVVGIFVLLYSPGGSEQMPIYHVVKETVSTSTAAGGDVKYTIHTASNQSHDKLVVSLSGSDGSYTADAVVLAGVGPATSTPKYAWGGAPVEGETTAQLLARLLAAGAATSSIQLSRGAPVSVHQATLSTGPSADGYGIPWTFAFLKNAIPTHCSSCGWGEDEFGRLDDPSGDFSSYETVVSGGIEYAVFQLDAAYFDIDYAFEWPLLAGALVPSYTLVAGSGEILLEGSDGSVTTVTVPGVAPPHTPFAAYAGWSTTSVPLVSALSDPAQFREVLSARSAVVEGRIDLEWIRPLLGAAPSGNGYIVFVYPDTAGSAESVIYSTVGCQGVGSLAAYNPAEVGALTVGGVSHTVLRSRREFPPATFTTRDLCVRIEP